MPAPVDWALMHPSNIWVISSDAAVIQGLHGSITEALKTVDKSEVRGIGVSGQQHGMVLLDESATVLRDAKLWCDVEAADEAKQISEAAGISY
eukprot:scaffold397539_cov52-Prasinocladus_malaysianus.AAC.1